MPCSLFPSSQEWFFQIHFINFCVLIVQENNNLRAAMTAKDVIEVWLIVWPLFIVFMYLHKLKRKLSLI